MNTVGLPDATRGRPLGPAPHFLLIGNGPYSNRGCEAIVRGTMVILRAAFGAGVRVTVASFGAPARLARQAADETDPGIAHLALGPAIPPRGSPAWWIRQFRLLGPPYGDRQYRPSPRPFPRLARALGSAMAALEIGGDNYSLDYGWPEPYLALDRYVQRRGVPVVLWGASVGPFDAAPPPAQARLARHLAALRAVFVRESLSRDYVARWARVEPVFMADPAFLMPPAPVDARRLGLALPADAIGVNLSPLMARYAAAGDLRRWTEAGAAFLSHLRAATGRPILLVPHVGADDERNDDGAFLRCVRARLGAPADVVCVPDTLTAPELKTVIASCAVFAGARAHATIAALSSGVPTVSFAYSVKALGIQADVLGSRACCVAPAEWTAPESVADRVRTVLADAPAVRAALRRALPAVRARALAAGPRLRDVLGWTRDPGGHGDGGAPREEPP